MKKLQAVAVWRTAAASGGKGSGRDRSPTPAPMADAATPSTRDARERRREWETWPGKEEARPRAGAQVAPQWPQLTAHGSEEKRMAATLGTPVAFEAFPRTGGGRKTEHLGCRFWAYSLQIRLRLLKQLLLFS
jgi:hypothetical protein